MATGTIKTQPKPTNITYPLSTDRTTPWTFTADKIGVLNLCFRSTSRKYIGITWNGYSIGGYATEGQNNVVMQQVFCKSGDVVVVTELDSNHVLVATLTSFVSFE